MYSELIIVLQSSFQALGQFSKGYAIICGIIGLYIGTHDRQYNSYSSNLL